MNRAEGIRATAILVAAVSVSLFAFRYVAELTSITIRHAWDKPFFYHGPLLGRSLSLCDWLIAALLLYIATPLVDRLPGVRTPGSTLAFITSLVGAVLVALPLLYFVGRTVEHMVRMTICGLWATEGILYSIHYPYYHNMALVLLPWVASGIVLVFLSRILPTPNDRNA